MTCLLNESSEMERVYSKRFITSSLLNEPLQLKFKPFANAFAGVGQKANPVFYAIPITTWKEVPDGQRVVHKAIGKDIDKVIRMRVAKMVYASLATSFWQTGYSESLDKLPDANGRVTGNGRPWMENVVKRLSVVSGLAPIDTTGSVMDALWIEWFHEAVARTLVKIKSLPSFASQYNDSVAMACNTEIPTGSIIINRGFIEIMVHGLTNGETPVSDPFWNGKVELIMSGIRIMHLRREGSADAPVAMRNFLLRVSRAKNDFGIKTPVAYRAGIQPVHPTDMQRAKFIAHLTELGQPGRVAQPKEKPRKRKKPNPRTKVNKEYAKLLDACITPAKKNFLSFEEAEEFMAKHENLRRDPDLHGYRCSCGGIHIGHHHKSSVHLKRATERRTSA